MRLLIVRVCAVGDFVLNLPALRALAVAHPSATFTLIGNPETLSLARLFLPVDAIHSIETQPWCELYNRPSPELNFDRAWVWMKDAAVANNLRRSGIPQVVHAPAFPNGTHAAEHLVRTVGLPAPPFPDLWEGGSRVILHPGSGSPRKNWPRFEELAMRLPESEVLIGPADNPLQVPRPCIKDLSLLQVVEELRRSRAFIGNDSGMTHLASYCGVPAIALYGPTDAAVWGPIGRRVTVLRKPSIADISVDDVLESFRQL